MDTVILYVKCVSGDLLSLVIPSSLPSLDLYTAAFQAFPEEDRPDSLYDMQLLRMDQEGSSFLFPLSSERMHVADQECLVVLVEEPLYRVYLEYLGDACSMEEDQLMYERYLLSVTCKNTVIYKKQFYQTAYCNLIQHGEHPLFYLIGPDTHQAGEQCKTGDGFYLDRFYVSDPALLRFDTPHELFSLLSVGPRTLQILSHELHLCIQKEYESWSAILRHRNQI